MKKGFTLIEMLVVIAVLAVFGTLILIIFTRTLRGGGKTQIIEAIKQNGQSVLEVMDKTVRNAAVVYCPNVVPPNSNGSVSSNTLVVFKDGIFTRFRLVTKGTVNSTIYPLPCNVVDSNNRSNGCIIQDNPTIINPITKNEETETQFKDRVCNPNDPMTSATVMSDTNLQTGVSIESGLFTRETAIGYKDQLTIKFDLGAAVGAPQVVGPIDPVTFQTTVQIR